MLYQELPRIDATPLDGWGRWLVPALVFGAALSAALVLLLIGQTVAAGAALFAGAVGAVVQARRPASLDRPGEPLVVGPDYALVGSALSLTAEPAALTSGEDRC